MLNFGSHMYLVFQFYFLGGIQQLRGQEEGEGGGPVKSQRLSTQGGGSLGCPRGQKPI